MTAARALSILVLAVVLAACGDDGQRSEDAWTWDLPDDFPEPRVPSDNPMSASKVELGRRLFYDRRLSGNQTQACASCHAQARAFSDGLRASIGSTGEPHFRNAMALVNVAYNDVQTWANSSLVTLERQALIPMFGEAPVELGLVNREAELLVRLADDPIYQDLFVRAFPADPAPIALVNVTRALAAFQRSLISARSAWDRYTDGDRDAISAAARRGGELFFGEKIECHHCHGGFNFPRSATWEGKLTDEPLFANNGLYDLDGQGAYPATDQGLIEVTGLAGDMGRFRAPTLRNIAVTAPYMHDGSIATLEDVIDHYARGGRLITEGPDAGDGRTSPLRSALVGGFTLTGTEREDLLEFLRSLTDDDFLVDPRHADPWAGTVSAAP